MTGFTRQVKDETEIYIGETNQEAELEAKGWVKMDDAHRDLIIVTLRALGTQNRGVHQK